MTPGVTVTSEPAQSISTTGLYSHGNRYNKSLIVIVDKAVTKILDQDCSSSPLFRHSEGCKC